MHFTVSKSAEQLSLKLMGISPLHGSHPAVPFASGATSSHGLRLYGSIIITIERSWRQLLRQAAYETLAGIAIRFHPSFGGSRRASPTALFLSKRIRLLYAALIRRFLFQGTIRLCQPVKMHW